MGVLFGQWWSHRDLRQKIAFIISACAVSWGAFIGSSALFVPGLLTVTADTPAQPQVQQAAPAQSPLSVLAAALPATPPVANPNHVAILPAAQSARSNSPEHASPAPHDDSVGTVSNAEPNESPTPANPVVTTTPTTSQPSATTATTAKPSSTTIKPTTSTTRRSSSTTAVHTTTTDN